jgi:hypothetical protein
MRGAGGAVRVRRYSASVIASCGRLQSMYWSCGVIVRRRLPASPCRRLGVTLRDPVGKAVERGEGEPPRWSGAAALKSSGRPAGVGERKELPRAGAEGTRRILPSEPWRDLERTLRSHKERRALRPKRSFKELSRRVGRTRRLQGAGRPADVGGEKGRPGAGAGRERGPSLGPGHVHSGTMWILPRRNKVRHTAPW